jgi:hypothetical protein
VQRRGTEAPRPCHYRFSRARDRRSAAGASLPPARVSNEGEAAMTGRSGPPLAGLSQDTAIRLR